MILPWSRIQIRTIGTRVLQEWLYSELRSEFKDVNVKNMSEWVTEKKKF